MARMNWDKANKQKKLANSEPERKPTGNHDVSPYGRMPKAGPVKITRADGTVTWQQPLQGDVKQVKRKKGAGKPKKKTNGLATQKQKNFMRVLGIAIPDGLSSKDASILISAALKNKSKEENS